MVSPEAISKAARRGTAHTDPAAFDGRTAIGICTPGALSRHPSAVSPAIVSVVHLHARRRLYAKKAGAP